ncbi:Hypothetical predicted protein [Paramuricea clavata]|uniref:Uncharacterized protein n=1 Tax=Paramuricea clavata TaxID=317549 RepID=A0A6S7INW7_PARCT|nr:Hypothetical predicted protein [Paramuricea clavata]
MPKFDQLKENHLLSQSLVLLSPVFDHFFLTAIFSHPMVTISYPMTITTARLCPLCFNHFTANEIAAHVDECAHRFDPVGIVSDDDNDNDVENIIGISVLSGEPKNTSVDPTIKEIMEVISSKLCPNVNKDNTNRVSIRRKYAFQDYVGARKNPR